MTFKNSLKTAWVSLKNHKLRAFLTILGIVIGITSIILIMSLGGEAQNLILKQIQGMGSKTIIIIPGREPSGPSDFAQVLFNDSLKKRDLESLLKRENVPTISDIMPVVFGSEVSSYQGDTYRLTIFGASQLISKIFDIYPSEGRFFNEEEIKSAADVIVIGHKVKEEFFGSSQGVGERIRIKDRSLKVVGVLPKKGQVSFFNFDDMAIVPYTTAQQYIFGIKHFHRLIVEAESEEVINQTVKDITRTLRENHGILDPKKDDFFVQTSADLEERFKIVTNVLKFFLTAVAAISLLVGGIGIMNIMLVSVTERTSEIGLRKALGATESDIMRQFLLESIILTILGGIIGIVLGTFLSFLSLIVLSKSIGFELSFSLPISAAILGLVVSSLVGIVFGLYPARQASLKNPIDALRYE